MKKLLLLPNVLHEDSPWRYTPPSIDALIAESEKGGYQFFKRFEIPKCPLYLLNEHTAHPSQLVHIEEAIVGLISDAGLPCLADPGSTLVAEAHKRGIEIEALPGPSSIILALQLSGFSGQAFTFHGYFPREEKEIATFCKTVSSQTHIFIETPYKTPKIFHLLLKYLPWNAKLCIAAELMSLNPYLRVDSVESWSKKSLSLPKSRAVFLITPLA